MHWSRKEEKYSVFLILKKDVIMPWEVLQYFSNQLQCSLVCLLYLKHCICWSSSSWDKRNLKVKSLQIWVSAFFKLEACNITLNELMPQTPKMDSYFLTSFELLIRNYFMIWIYEDRVFSVYWLLSSKNEGDGECC